LTVLMKSTKGSHRGEEERMEWLWGTSVSRHFSFLEIWGPHGPHVHICFI
jgi:hypothetical protein